MTDQTPPTDRPLTAGDVPLLREGDLVAPVSDLTDYRGGKLLARVPVPVLNVSSDGYIRVTDPERGHHSYAFTFVSRPATSAASERERLARAVYAKRPSWMIHPDNRALTWEEAAEDAPDRVACIYRDVDAILAALSAPFREPKGFQR